MLSFSSMQERGEIDQLVPLGCAIAELNVVLPSRYRRFTNDDDAERHLWLDVSTPAVLEMAVDNGRVAAIALATQEDFVAVLVDELQAMSSPREALDSLEGVYGALPVLESFRRGLRVMVPQYPLVIELRGRRELERADVLAGDSAYRAIDAHSRAQMGERPTELFGPWRPMGGGRYLSANGWYGAQLLDSGGFAISPPSVFCSWLETWLIHEKAVAVVDGRVSGIWPYFTRRNRLLDSGELLAEWWLPSVGILVSMVDGRSAVVSCDLTEEGV